MHWLGLFRPSLSLLRNQMVVSGGPFRCADTGGIFKCCRLIIDEIEDAGRSRSLAKAL